MRTARQPTSRIAVPPVNRWRCPVLVSYAFLRELPEHRCREIVEDRRIELLVDSGAFTALNAGYAIDLGEYIDWLHRHKQHLHGYIALDVLKDPKATERNLNVMLKAGLKPVPVHVYGDDGKRMDDLFAVSDWVALGGLRRPHRGSCSPEYLKQKMAWAAGRRVHWLGYTDRAHLAAFRPYSADCASAASGNMYGRAGLYLGDGRWTNLSRPYAGHFVPEVVNGLRSPELLRLCEHAQVPHADLLDPSKWCGAKHHVGSKVSHFSWVWYAHDLYLRFRVRMFIAQVPSIYLSCLSPAITKFFDSRSITPTDSPLRAAPPKRKP